MAYEVLDYTFSLITQGRHKFYSLTIPSDVLGNTCFVTARYDDPVEGFQRRLDEKRAKEIALYIDQGFGTIPSAVILSAQKEAGLIIKPGGRALQFKRYPKSFLVIDGQHRIWGYRMAQTHLRVPVLIYQNMTKLEETRLFIDINTKQRAVPNELLLDIKHLADLETDVDTLYRELFDRFKSSSDSALSGMLTPHEKAKGKLSRTTVNAAFATISGLLTGKDIDEIYPVLNAYFWAADAGLKRYSDERYLTTPNIFKAIVAFFPEVASKVKDRFDGEYTSDNFAEILQPVLDRLNKNTFSKAKTSYKSLQESLQNSLTKGFTL